MTRRAKSENGVPHRWLDAHVSYRGDDCLIWPFSCTTPGYGQFSMVGSKGKQRSAHRYMCEAVNGPAPSPSHLAAHSCGNRACVNPQHLSWKTHAENQLDRHEQNQPFYGRRRTLTEDQVREMRALKGKMRAGQIAAKFGCTESNVRHVQNFVTYRNVKALRGV